MSNDATIGSIPESILAATSLAGPISPVSNTDIRFRTAETLPLGATPGSDISILPLLRHLDTQVADTSSSPSNGHVVESVMRYDLMLLMVNMTNKKSWEECKRALLCLDPSWFMGRCAVVVTRVAAVSKYAFERDDITEFLNSFSKVPVVWTNLEVASEASLAAIQIVRMLEISAGYRRRGRNSLSTRSSPFGAITSSGISVSSGTTLPKQAIETSISSSEGNTYAGFNMGRCMTVTHLLIQTPEKYIVPVTTLHGDTDRDNSNEGTIARE
ncbi:hypothetical protein BG011_002995 [Mortierella polycephala]|uniref:Centromere protein M n=1 Tax=Mortierella polycephala TaxID=41804 RepID=A0A9P6U4J0_9FUNG|nr:hypothetical protein BG011_002995 [Mortierella polycephala]